MYGAIYATHSYIDGNLSVGAMDRANYYTNRQLYFYVWPGFTMKVLLWSYGWNKAILYIDGDFSVDVCLEQGFTMTQNCYGAMGGANA